MVRRIVKAPLTGTAIVVTSQVLIKAYSKLMQDKITEVSILGVDFVAQNLMRTLVNSVGAVAAGLFVTLTALNWLTPTATLFGIAFALNVWANPINCEEYVSKLPAEPKHQHERRLLTLPGETDPKIHYATLPPEKPDKVFIKDTEENEIFVPTSKVECEPSKPFKIKRQNNKDKVLIRRQCERDFVPLKQRTKTLADIKDPSQPYLNRNAERLKAQRQKINRDREKEKIRVKNEYRNENWEL